MNHSKIFDYIDPVLFSIGQFDIRWYSIAYIAGILLGIRYAKYLAEKFQLPITRDQIEDFMVWLIIGIIVGGRLGYVIFYDPILYLNNPIDIFKTYEGGMSFYGGCLGVLISTFLFSKYKKINFISLLDLICTVCPIGIFFGRCANFINGELVGRVTQSSFGIVFPGYYEARHPSQLYEAFFEGIVLFIILSRLTFKYKSIRKPGLNLSLAMIGYGFFRMIIENFREPDPQLGFIILNLTMGQLQSIILLLVGIFYLFRLR